MERRVQLAYTEATNIYSLGSELTHSDLVDAFTKFEKTDRIGEVDPAVARRGRWVLIYGVLQTLASVSVDSPNVKYREDVPYHLSPRLKGTKIPPWKAVSAGKGKGRRGDEEMADEAAHELSHCWVVAGKWHVAGMQSGSSGGEDDEGSDDMGPARGGQFLMAGLPGNGTYSRSPTGGVGWSSGGGWATPAGRSAQSVYSSAQSVMSESDAQSRTSSRPGAMPIRRKEYGGYHEGTHGVYGRGQGHGDAEVRREAPRIRDFDLDVIDDEP